MSLTTYPPISLTPLNITMGTGGKFSLRKNLINSLDIISVQMQRDINNN